MKRSTMSLQVNWKRSLGSNLQAGGKEGRRQGEGRCEENVKRSDNGKGRHSLVDCTHDLHLLPTLPPFLPPYLPPDRLKTLDFISAKLLLIRRVSKAWSALFTATKSVMTWTKRRTAWAST